MIAVRRSGLSRLGALTGLVVLCAGGTVHAQSPKPTPSPAYTGEPSPVPRAAEVALCEDEGAALLGGGAVGSLIATRAGADVVTVDTSLPTQLDGPPPGSAGCRAPTTPFDNPFADGTIDLFAIRDTGGDGPLDIERTLWGEVELSGAEARELRRDDKVVVIGTRANVLKAGRFQAVCVELAADPVVGDTIHIATDVEGDPFQRIPSAVSLPTGDFANLRDVATLVVEEGGQRLFSSDLSTGEWYMGKGRYGALLDGRDACFLFPVNQLGEDFRPVTYRPGDAGGFDTGGLGSGPGLLATGGTFGWIDDCIEQLLIHEPLMIEDVQVSASTDWVTFCFSASDSDLDEIDDFIDDVGDSNDVADGLIRFTLREEGEENEQTVPLEVWTDVDRVYFRFPVGLKAYGFHALRDVEIMPTDDDLLDEIFDEAARAIGRRVNPTHFDATAGRLQGDRECQAPPGEAAAPGS